MVVVGTHKSCLTMGEQNCLLWFSIVYHGSFMEINVFMLMKWEMY